VHELVPAVSARFNVVNHRNGRGVFGKSSGGFGAIHLAMTYDECWGAVASHSGDVGFDLVYRPAFAEVCTVLADYNGNIEEFIRTFWTRNRPASREFNTLMILAMAASYTRTSSTPFRLPFDLRTCTLDTGAGRSGIPRPHNRVERCAGALRSLHGSISMSDAMTSTTSIRQPDTRRQDGKLGINFPTKSLMEPIQA
jgi:hypothetical protein